MVNNRPLFVQKWNPEIGLLKVEPTKMPLWIKMVNIPMEAWSVEGISAMASSLGKPLVMDSVTAHMCQFGVGRADYARVLVEVEAGKQMKSEIKIEYTDMNKCLKGTKVVKVEYDWKPDCCSHCKVFGHVVDQCNVRPRTEKEIQDKREAENKVQVANKPKFQEEFVPVQNRKSNMQACSSKIGIGNIEVITTTIKDRNIGRRMEGMIRVKMLLRKLQQHQL